MYSRELYNAIRQTMVDGTHARFLRFVIWWGFANRTIPQKMGKVEHNRQTVLSLLNGGDAPTVLRLIHDAGVQRDTVVRGGGGAAGVVHADLLHAGNGIGPGPQQGGQGDGVASFQGVDLAEEILSFFGGREDKRISYYLAGKECLRFAVSGA